MDLGGIQGKPQEERRRGPGGDVGGFPASALKVIQEWTQEHPGPQEWSKRGPGGNPGDCPGGCPGVVLEGSKEGAMRAIELVQKGI